MITCGADISPLLHGYVENEADSSCLVVGSLVCFGCNNKSTVEVPINWPFVKLCCHVGWSRPERKQLY